MDDEKPASTVEPEDTGISLEDAIAMMPEDSPEESDPNTTAKATDDDGPKTDDAEDKHPEDAEDDKEKVAAEDEAAQEIKDEAVIALRDGKTASFADLVHAYYEVDEVKASTTRERAEVASERGNLQSLGANMAQALENVSNYLVQRLPPEPDPQLAYTDPGEHYRRTMVRNNAIAELQDMLAVVEGSKAATSTLSEADFNAIKADEDQKLIAALPNLKDPKRFSAATSKSKAYWLSIGGTEGEYDTTADHRIRRMAIDAAYGKEARQAASKAKGKVENASPMLPAKARQHPNSKLALEQVNALKRLEKTGSIEDAMKLNF